MSETQLNIIVTDSDLANSHGETPVRMNNDYLFRALMQSNDRVLKAFICSLLHLNPDEVNAVTVLNPIELGETIDNKAYILDIKVNLDGHTIINLELQVVNEGDWIERSLCYLCRTFDNPKCGEDYINVQPAIQIGILDYTLFKDSPEFFANYYLTNIKNHHIYSSKFRLSVLDLTQINLATDEDRAYHIDQWAMLFKSDTWEELYMLAQKNPDIKEAVRTVYRLTQDEKIRQQCEAREDYNRREKDKQIIHERAKQERDQAMAEKAQLEAKLNLAEAESERLRNILRKHGINADETDK